jgi:Domain of Unknown Function with PDB structure (DUF3857)/Transglutaminase-like superfamily
MNTRFKVLTAVLPVAILAGPFGAGRLLADQTSVMPTAQTRPAPAKEPAQASQMPYTGTYLGHVTIRTDRSAVDEFTKRFKILTASAINLVSQQHEIFVEGMETLETVDAFTEKPDGTRVPVDPANILTRDAATGLQSTFSRDMKQRTVIFQDVQVGDTLVLTQRKETKRGLFPGQYFAHDGFPRTGPFVSAEIVIESPAGLDLQVKTTSTALTDTVEDVGNLRRHTIGLARTAFSLPEARSVSAVDVDPMVFVSTFKSYVEMGRAYGEAAFPKAAVTPEITALADEITKGIDNRRKQAMAIDAWMKKNIRYVGVYLANGRVVPHDAASVLRNKFGDCKDKATLMSALLAAKGIASEHVLINFGDTYTLPEPPTMAALNHAILYLPEFDLYDDPTAQFAAFGVLAAETYDKPLVRVSPNGAMLGHTPPMKPQDHVASLHTSIKVAADGTVTGRTVERNTGIFAFGLRAAGATVQTVGGDNAARMQLQAFGNPGTGRYDIGNVTETADPVVVTGTFTLADKFKSPAQDARASIPIGMQLTVRPGNFLLGTLPNNRQMPFLCFAGRQIEDIDATYDQGLPMPIAPGPTTINNAAFSYRANFKVEGRTLKIHREFESHVAHQVCEPGLESRILGDMNAVRGNVNTNYVFRTPEPPAAATGPSAAVTGPLVATPAPNGPSKASAPLIPVSTTTGTAPAAPVPPKPVEISRVVAADRDMRLDFLYSINPDCTSMGYPAVRTVERPKHGTITIENSTGFSNFPADNLRAECNKRRSDGVAIIYKPEPGYTGPDSVDFDAIFASGTLSKRHYTIEVR